MTESDRAAGGPAPDAQATSAAAATAASTAARDVPHQPWEGTSLQQLRSVLQQFAAERDWGQYHTPRNLVLALVGAALGKDCAGAPTWHLHVLPGAVCSKNAPIES